MTDVIHDQPDDTRIRIRLEARAAEQFWKHVKPDHLALLRDAEALYFLPEHDRRRVELNLITFLANCAFGEDDVSKHRGTSRLDYFARLREINPRTVRLMREPADRHVVLEVEMPGGTLETLKLGPAIGYSAMIPLTVRGYHAYLSNEISAFQFDRDHILGPDAGDAQCYLYGEGAFHLGALKRFFPPGVSYDHPLSTYDGITRIFQHVGELLPPLWLNRRGQLVSDRSGGLPIVLFADNGVIAESLKSRGFTQPASGFPAAGKAGYPRYMLDLADYNRADIIPARRHQIHRFVDCYLGLTTPSSRASAAVGEWLDEAPPQKALPEIAPLGSPATLPRATGDAAFPSPARFADRPARKQEWCISYAWGDDTEEGRTREAVVDQLCADAAARGITIIRDKSELGLGERITEFMQRLGEADRCFVILSDKYLKSRYCMFELRELWRNCRKNREEFLRCVRVYALPDAKISMALDRVRYAQYWKQQVDELAPHFEFLGEQDAREYRLMKEYVLELGDILATIAGILLPRDIEQLKQYGFADAPVGRRDKA